jgi:hypothetical protein
MKKHVIDDDWPDASIEIDRPRRRWFLAALILIVTAIVAEMLSKRYAGLGMTTMARAAQSMNDAKRFEDLGMDDLAQIAADESARLRQAAFRNPNPANCWRQAGLGL